MINDELLLSFYNQFRILLIFGFLAAYIHALLVRGVGQFKALLKMLTRN